MRLGERLTKITFKFFLTLKTCNVCTDIVLISIREVNIKTSHVDHLRWDHQLCSLGPACLSYGSRLGRCQSPSGASV